MKKGLTEEQQERRWRSGRGQGTGAEYKPWIEVADFPSSDGVRTNLNGLVTGRMHACLSSLERCAVLVAQRLPHIVDIREQFPLPLEDTDRIAAALGIKAPEFQGHAQRVTTDLVYTFDDGRSRWDEANAIKPSSELEDVRVQELLCLEYVYWKELQTQWRISTELELTKTILGNLDWLNQHAFLHDSRLDEDTLRGIELAIVAGVERAPRLPINKTCLKVDDALGIEPGLALTAFRHFVAVDRWKVDVYSDFGPGHPVPRPFSVPHLGRTFGP